MMRPLRMLTAVGTAGVAAVALAVAPDVTIVAKLTAAETTPVQMDYRLTASAVTELPITLVKGSRVTFRTTQVTGDEDPVLNILNPAGVQVAVDDNSGGGLAAAVTYRQQQREPIASSCTVERTERLGGRT